MKAKTPRPRGRKARRRANSLAAAALGSSQPSELSAQLEQVSLLPFLAENRAPTRFKKLLEASQEPPLPLPPQSSSMEADEVLEERDCCILSQDFFCTPDYITPDAPQPANGFEVDKEDIHCPKSPEKSVNARSKRYKRDYLPSNLQTANFSGNQKIAEVKSNCFGLDEFEEQPLQTGLARKSNYVSQSAVSLRCRVMPPPCIKNPYLKTNSSIDDDVFCGRQYKSSALSPLIGGDGLSRYRTDFHEIEQIGCGNFSRVFKVLKRIDGCLYAVKQSIKLLHNEGERRHAVKEVQALAALGCHENIVGYFTSWFENEQLYIQMELCDSCLSTNRNQSLKCGEALEMLYQISKALEFIHERGVAHLDVKPDNIYIRNGVYKLGDFGCATLINRNLAIEEGDSRYMPPEMLNDNYEHLDKVDIFSLGAATYELIRGTPLPDSGPQFITLREGKISLLPGCPLQLQSLIKSMMDPDPVGRPSAREVLGHPVFEKLHKVSVEQPNIAEINI